MDDINTVYALLVLIMFFVLLSRLDNRFGKIERELNEIARAPVGAIVPLSLCGIGS